MKRLLLIAALGLQALLAACSQGEDRSMVGTLERDRVEVTVETNQPIVSRHVADGQTVAAGDLLMRQDPSVIQTRLDHAQAQRDQASARLAELQRGPRPEAIRETRARLEAARAQAANANSERVRVRGVHERGLASDAALELAETRAESARAEAQAVREALEAQLEGTTAEELDQATAALAAAEAVLAEARIELQRTEIRAPVAGTVDKLLFQIGERPVPGTTVAVILDASRVFARVYVPEYLRAGVRPGRRVRVRIDGAPEPYQGTVRWVSADASFTPYFALTEHDRSRLSYLAEVDVPDARDLPSGIPLEVDPPGDGSPP